MTTNISLVNSSVKRYTLQDIENIKYSNIIFNLEPAVLDKIKHIANEVGSPEYVKTPQFPKREKYLKKKGRNYKSNFT